MKIPNPIRRWLRRDKTPVSGRYEATRFSFDRSWLPGLTQDAIKDITSGERFELIRRTRYFEKNSPLVQQILDLIEQNVVGTGITPTPESSDKAYNQKALAKWSEWCKYADNTSRQSFQTLQAIIARAQACDGEIFAYLAEGEKGRPRIQLVEAHRVKGSIKLPSPYDKYVNADGILLDERGRPAFYCVENGVTVSDSVKAGSVTILPAEKFVHFFEPSRAGQYHGIPLFHSVLITLHDLDDLQRYEMIAAKDASARANVVKTEAGEFPDEGSVIARSKRVVKDDGSSETKRVYYEQAFGGKTVVLKKGDDWKQSESQRPSAAMREFWEYLTEQVCRGVGISYAAVKGYAGNWGGAALRAAIVQDNRFYEVRTNVLIAGLQRIFEYVVGYSNDKGELGAVPADWRKVQWQSPRRSTVDVGRESAAIINELRSGLRTETDILAELGVDADAVRSKRCEEVRARLDQAKEIATAYNLPLLQAYGLLSELPQTVAMAGKPAIGATQPNVTAVLAHSSERVVAFMEECQRIDIAEGQEMPDSFVWMPAGKHTISAGSPSGKAWKGTVICDAKGALAVVSAFNDSLAAGRRVWIDFNHEDAEAAGWVKGFAWEPDRGIVCYVEWTPDGVEALKNKSYYSFSPAFLVDEDGRVAGLIFGHAAGGLVNAPAFGAAMPALIAARMGGENNQKPAPGGSPEQTNTMKDILLKLLAALNVNPPADATEQHLAELVAKHSTEAQAAKSAEVAKLKSDLEAVKASEIEAKKKADEAAEAVKAAKAKEHTAPVVIIAPGVEGVEAGAGCITSKPNMIDAVKAMAKVDKSEHRKRGAIYCSDIRSQLAKANGVMEILAENSLGSVAGDLIVLRALDLLKLNFPVLSAITTDFSDQQARQGQAVKTRIVSVPSVVSLNDSTGWASSDTTTTDVSVTIGQPKGVQIVYTSTELAGTSRDLFGEQVEAAHYALGKDLVDALYALITSSNFTNVTTKALASFARADIVAMGKALTGRGVSQMGRTLLLNQDYYEKAQNDTTLVNLGQYQRADIITDGTLPPISKFNVIEAVNLPTTGNLTGFGFTKDALVMAARLPEDYTRAFPGASHGNLSVVTNPDTGISVQKVDFVDHILAKAYSRIAWAYGVAKGQAASGQRLVSA